MKAYVKTSKDNAHIRIVDKCDINAPIILKKMAMA